MQQDTLNYYLSTLKQLKRGGTPWGKAPHKPVLLLTLLELIEKGIVPDNKFRVTAELVGTFQENWYLLVNTPHLPDFTLPFYHLQNDRLDDKRIWFLQPKPGCQINSHIKSVNRLAEVLDYGCFSEDLFLLMADPLSRNVIKTTLLDTYFILTRQVFLQNKAKGEGYIHDMENYLLNEPEAKFKHISIHTEEDIFVRGGLLSIDDNYRILVSPHISEKEEHPYALKQLKGKQIALPENSLHYPAQDKLEWHRGNVFKI